MARPASPRRPLNPSLLEAVRRSGHNQSILALATGFPSYTIYWELLRSEMVSTTPLTVLRLQRLADLLGFPREQIFLDEGAE